jgi:hypothetical protein
MTTMMDYGAVAIRMCGRYHNGESSENNKRQQKLLQRDISNCG